MLLVFSYSYSVELPNQKYLLRTVKENFDDKYSAIMPETDWKDKELKGKVKSMTEITYKYEDNEVKKKKTIFNKNGYIIEELQYDKNRKEPYSYKKRYNDKGLLIESHEHTYTYEYDENGYLIRSVDVYGIEHEYEYEYDENGYLVQTDRERKKRSFANMKKNFYNKDGKLAKSQLFTQSEYSKKGIKLSSSAKYEKDKKKGLFELLSEETYVYDKNGKLLRIDDTKASANREYIVITFENFKDGKSVKTVEVNGIQAFKTCYDKDGNEIEWAWITYSPEEQIQTFILYSGIKKDKYGNLIEKTGKYLEITDGGKKLGKETEAIAEEMKIEYKYYE